MVTFDGAPAATVTSSPTGTFDTNFNVPLSSSIGPQDVVATQGSNSASKTFTVTSLVPVIILDPISGPVGTSVDIIGTGFSPNSTVTITFGGSTVTTTPFPLKTNNTGEFSANFAVPESSNGPQPLVASQGANTASKTFIVTPSPATTSLSNFRSIEAPGNQSNATLSLPPANQSKASVPIVTNSSFGNTKSNGFFC